METLVDGWMVGIVWVGGWDTEGGKEGSHCGLNRMEQRGLKGDEYSDL